MNKNMIFLFLAVLLIPYGLMWSNERKFIARNAQLYGKCINVSHLSLFTIDGEDKLFWGSKVYLHEKCIIIALPLTSWSLVIPYSNIKFPRVTKQLISFCYPTGDYNSLRFNLQTSLSDNNISSHLSKLISNNNSGVITC